MLSSRRTPRQSSKRPARPHPSDSSHEVAPPPSGSVATWYTGLRPSRLFSSIAEGTRAAAPPRSRAARSRRRWSRSRRGCPSASMPSEATTVDCTVDGVVPIGVPASERSKSGGFLEAAARPDRRVDLEVTPIRSRQPLASDQVLCRSGSLLVYRADEAAFVRGAVLDDAEGVHDAAPARRSRGAR